MNLSIRPMALHEVDVVIDYFHEALPEHLETLGVDPTRLPARSQWRRSFTNSTLRLRENSARTSLERFLTYLANERYVSCATQNQAYRPSCFSSAMCRCWICLDWTAPNKDRFE